MKAAFINQVGPPENIQYGDLPTPAATGCKYQKVGACVNPIIPHPQRCELSSNRVIGCDLAGVVTAVGPSAKRFKVGDRVWGSNQGLMGRQGTFAEFCAVDEGWLYPTPTNTKDEDAAACALVGITAHLGLFQNARLRAGETLFVNGGSGGVGSMVIQMAKACGRVATAGSEENWRNAEAWSGRCGQYKTQDIAAAVRTFPNGSQRLLGDDHDPDRQNRFVSQSAGGSPAGARARPHSLVGPFYVKGCSLHGFDVQSHTRRTANHRGRHQSLLRGKLRSKISSVFPLSGGHPSARENTRKAER
jgi:NADPH2:quinone reductase